VFQAGLNSKKGGSEVGLGRQDEGRKMDIQGVVERASEPSAPPAAASNPIPNPFVTFS